MSRNEIAIEIARAVGLFLFLVGIIYGPALIAWG